MKSICYSLIFLFGIAFCGGCGDKPTQSWEDSKPKAGAAKSDSKSEDVANNDMPDNSTAGNETESNKGSGEKESPHPMVNAHSSANPHVAMKLPVAGESAGKSEGRSAGENSAPENDGKLEIGPFHWTVPKTWTRKNPGMMVTAEYSIPHSVDDSDNARLTLSQARGTVEGNIDRWKNKQFTKLDRQKQENFEVSGLKVTFVDYSGTFLGMQMPGMAAAAPHADYRMLGAIVEVPGETDMLFIKCYGPEKTIAANADEIKTFIRSMKVDK